MPCSVPVCRYVKELSLKLQEAERLDAAGGVKAEGDPAGAEISELDNLVKDLVSKGGERAGEGEGRARPGEGCGLGEQHANKGPLHGPLAPKLGL